jgi:hypothetical protein
MKQFLIFRLASSKVWRITSDTYQLFSESSNGSLHNKHNTIPSLFFWNFYKSCGIFLRAVVVFRRRILIAIMWLCINSLQNCLAHPFIKSLMGDGGGGGGGDGG